MDFALHGPDLILSGTIGLLIWFIQKKFDLFDKQHSKHFEHAAQRDIHQIGMDQQLVGAMLENIRIEIKHTNEMIGQHIADDRQVMSKLHDETLENRRLTHERFNEIVKIIADSRKVEKG